MNTLDVKNLLKELKISPRKSMGQNFLISETVIHSILKTLEVQNFRSLIEVGPGLGALTLRLTHLECPLIVIELDHALAQYWRKNNVQVVENDALKFKWHPISLPAPTLLISNLPYQIASRLVVDLSIKSHSISTMILMFQREVAKRITSAQRTQDYGLLSVISQNFWTVAKVCDAGPSSFFPAPQVASRVLLFKKKQSPFALLSENGSWNHSQPAALFLEFVKSAFSNRRKYLAKNLQPWIIKAKPLAQRDKTFIHSAFEKMGYSSQLRAEELSPSQMANLFISLGCHNGN